MRKSAPLNTRFSETNKKQMQVYQHPSLPDGIILCIKQCPVMRSILQQCELTPEMQYHPQQQWFTMTHATYARLRTHLPELLSMQPASRPAPAPVAALPSQRSVYVQTDAQRGVAQVTREVQTEETEMMPPPPSVPPAPVDVSASPSSGPLLVPADHMHMGSNPEPPPPRAPPSVAPSSHRQPPPFTAVGGIPGDGDQSLISGLSDFDQVLRTRFAVHKELEALISV